MVYRSKNWRKIIIRSKNKGMTIEEVEAIIQDLRQKIPTLQVQLNQAEGYHQALIDMQQKKDKDAPAKTTRTS